MLDRLIQMTQEAFAGMEADGFVPVRIAQSGRCRWTMLWDGVRQILAKDRCLFISKTGKEQYGLGCDEEERKSILNADTTREEQT